MCIIFSISTDNPKKKHFDREILTALSEYAQMKERDKKDIDKIR